ncbi:hypothetical protein PATSB16_41190 [Pandoraea thiooxydans]|uniref:Peptidoglycan hydrolase FlgJ n=1 Tax=Pandoraea thiooxydans TaxID=445709 RepID=A0A0G3EWE9_9BURK|nr:flagellar assembly peptidoglycan hydrolase FlgJ [Pandoraea thiooxydans]AKJ69717.1 flagellar rod assembly protein/muramidase FlgJ [Pandoraea thiooxydans]APR97453.1 hypothetical protein PATSB16_41190 [Pandoraea thiooxydans]
MSDSPLIGQPGDLSQRLALDVQSVNALRQAVRTDPRAGVQSAARQFEAVFTQMLLQSMRDASSVPGALFEGDNQTQTYTEMLDQQLSQETSTKGIGLADMMLRQLDRAAGLQPGTTPLRAAPAPVPLTGRPFEEAGAVGVPAPRHDGTVAGNFVDRLAGAAQGASAKTGIPANFMLGQAALESGWGKHEIRRADGSASHNLFGIKAGKDWHGPVVEAMTTEYIHGVATRVKAKFRAYGSYQEAFTDYANLLRGNPRYAQVVASAGDARSFAQGLQRAGYATDPHYASKLMSVIRQMT